MVDIQELIPIEQFEKLKEIQNKSMKEIQNNSEPDNQSSQKDDSALPSNEDKAKGGIGEAGDKSKKDKNAKDAKSQSAEDVKEPSAEGVKGQSEKDQPKPQNDRVTKFRNKYTRFIDKKEPEKKEDTTDYKAKYEETLKIVQDPAVKAILEARKNNVNLVDLFSKFTVDDFKGKSNTEIWVDHLKRKGITDENILENEADKFDAMNILAQQELVDKIKAEVNKQKEEELIKLLGTPTAEAKEREAEAMNTLKASEELKGLTESIIGKEVYGVVYTPEINNQVIERISKGFPRREDGTIDTQEVFKMYFLAECFDIIIDTATKEAFASGVEEIRNVVEAKPDSDIHSMKPEINKKLQKGTEEFNTVISSELRPIV